METKILALARCFQYTCSQSTHVLKRTPSIYLSERFQFKCSDKPSYGAI